MIKPRIRPLRRNRRAFSPIFAQCKPSQRYEFYDTRLSSLPITACNGITMKDYTLIKRLHVTAEKQYHKSTSITDVKKSIVACKVDLSLYKQHTAYATETRRPTTHTRHQCDVYKKLTC